MSKRTGIETNPYLIAYFKAFEIQVGDEWKPCDYMLWIDEKHSAYRKVNNIYDFITLDESQVKDFIRFITLQNAPERKELEGTEEQIQKPAFGKLDWEDSKIQNLAYELYKLDWKSRISIDRKMLLVKEFFEDYPETKYVYDAESLAQWEFEQGYSGEIFVCFNEFLNAEYLDESYMKSLLGSEALYSQYKADVDGIPPKDIPSNISTANRKYTQLHPYSVYQLEEIIKRLINCKSGEIECLGYEAALCELNTFGIDKTMAEFFGFPERIS